MTIVVGLSSLFDAFVIADCRLTYSHQGSPIRRDVCQKVVLANAWSIVGLAGQLCMARHLMGGVVRRLRETSHTDPGWLKDDEQLLNFVAEGFRNHAHLGAMHRDCQQHPARLLIAWLDYDRHEPFLRETRTPVSQIVVVRVPEMDVRRTGRGLDIIGSGQRIANVMRRDAFDMLADFGRFAPEQEILEAHRALIATQVIRDLLLEHGGDDGVGGLFEVATLSVRGARTVPYFYLAKVEPGFKTYVAMRPEHGEYVQHHRPTQTEVPIESPFAIDPFAVMDEHAMFDPAALLTRDSPGVLPDQGLELLFSIYDPSDVPLSIQQSWGNAPLPPPTWAPLRDYP